ncbi:MAG: translation initiation factor IF-1 [Akkermansiaceae bacterium]
MFDPPIITEGTVIDSPKEKIYNVALPNGKIIIGHIPLSHINLHDNIKPNTIVSMELTPFDFSKGRITAIVK